jgi:hypothetical protein
MGISEANIFVTFVGERSAYDRDERRGIGIYSLCGPDAYEI